MKTFLLRFLPCAACVFALAACSPRPAPAPATSEPELRAQPELPDLGGFDFFPVVPAGPSLGSNPWAADSGKVVLVHFWTTWSRVCTYELPALNRMQGELGARGLQVVGVVLDQGPAAGIEAKLGELAPGFPNVRPEAALNAPVVEGLRVLPSKWLVDRNGRVRAKFQGVAAEAELRAAIESVL